MKVGTLIINLHWHLFVFLVCSNYFKKGNVKEKSFCGIGSVNSGLIAGYKETQ